MRRKRPICRKRKQAEAGTSKRSGTSTADNEQDAAGPSTQAQTVPETQDSVEPSEGGAPAEISEQGHSGRAVKRERKGGKEASASAKQPRQTRSATPKDESGRLCFQRAVLDSTADSR